jgi:hypothetical protein
MYRLLIALKHKWGLVLMVSMAIVLLNQTAGNAWIEAEQIEEQVESMLATFHVPIAENKKAGKCSLYLAPFRETVADQEVYRQNANFHRNFSDILQARILDQRHKIQNHGIELSIVDPDIVEKILNKNDVGIDHFLGRLIDIKDQIPAMMIMTGDIYYYNQDVFVAVRLIHVESCNIVWGYTFCFSPWGRQLIDNIQKQCSFLSHCFPGGMAGRVFSLIDMSNHDQASALQRVVYNIIEARFAERSSTKLNVKGEEDLEAVFDELRFETSHGVVKELANRIGGASKPEGFILFYYRSGEDQNVKLDFITPEGVVTGTQKILLEPVPEKYQLRVVYYPDRINDLSVLMMKYNRVVNNPPYYDDDNGDRVYRIDPGFYKLKFYQRNVLFEERMVVLDRSRSLFICRENEQLLGDIKKGRLPACSPCESKGGSMLSRIVKAYCVQNQGIVTRTIKILDKVENILRKKGCTVDSLDPDVQTIYYLCKGKAYFEQNRNHIAHNILKKALQVKQKYHLNIAEELVTEMKRYLYVSGKEVYNAECTGMIAAGAEELCGKLQRLLKSLEQQGANE